MTASTSAGMNAVDVYAGELRDAEDAVGRCFDVNEDMARVIAVAAEGAAAAIERSGDNNELDARRSSIIIDESREERLLFDGGRTPTVGGVDSAGSGRSRMEEKSSTERAGVRAWPKSPWEEAAAEEGARLGIIVPTVFRVLSRPQRTCRAIPKRGNSNEPPVRVLLRVRNLVMHEMIMGLPPIIIRL